MFYVFIYVLLFVYNLLASTNPGNQRMWDIKTLERISFTSNTVNAFFENIDSNRNGSDYVRKGKLRAKSTNLLDTAVTRATASKPCKPRSLKGGGTFNKLFQKNSKEYIDTNSKDFKKNANTHCGKTIGSIKGKETINEENRGNARAKARVRGLIAGVCWGPQNILALYTFAATPPGLLLCAGVNLAGYAVYTMPCDYEEKTTKDAYNHTKFWWMAWPVLTTIAIQALAATK